MSIRSKLLLVLVGFAILPMVIAFGVGQVSTRLVGARLSDAAQNDLLDEAEDRLLQYVRAAGALAGAEAVTVELIVVAQARAFRDALEAARELGPAPGGAYLSREDFDDRRRTPPGLAPDPDAVEAAREISYEAVSVLLAPGVAPEAVAPELAAHSRMLPDYRELLGYNAELVFAQYTATPGGTHSAYPGHGGYPADYDPRERPWYRLGAGSDARDSGKFVVWGPPIRDAPTGRAVLTVSAPVRDAGGRLLGVTAADVLITELIEGLERPPGWADREELFIVSYLGVDPADEGTALDIYARRDYDRSAGDWRRDIELDTFRLDDAAGNRAMIEAVVEHRSGVVVGVLEGEPSVLAFAPIYSGGAPTTAAVVCAIPLAEVVELAERIDEQFLAVTVGQLVTNASIALAVLAVVVLFAFKGSRTVSEPVLELAGAADRLAQGDLDARAEVGSRDEFGSLARSFNDMVPKLRDRMRLRDALDLAMEVQQSLLPSGPPTVRGFDIAGRSIYCDETGGDYYDYLVLHEVEDGALGVVIGDVTGHGIAAALLMTTARALLRLRFRQAGSLAEQIADINRELASGADHGRFMTLCYMLVERDALRWVSAGHDPPILYDPASGAFEELEGGGDPARHRAGLGLRGVPARRPAPGVGPGLRDRRHLGGPRPRRRHVRQGPAPRPRARRAPGRERRLDRRLDRARRRGVQGRHAPARRHHPRRRALNRLSGPAGASSARRPGPRTRSRRRPATGSGAPPRPRRSRRCSRRR